MKQYVITNLNEPHNVQKVDITDKTNKELVKKLLALNIEGISKGITPQIKLLNLLELIMNSSYSITIEESPDLLFDFSKDLQKSEREVLLSPEFQLIYDKNVENYIPNNLYWSSFVEEEFIQNAESLGYQITKFNFDISNSQGRGASFDGSLDIIKFMEIVDVYSYPELISAIKHGYVKEDVNIINNGFSNHYSHAKTRKMDNIEIISDETRQILDEERITLIEERMEIQRLELCDELFKDLEYAYEHEFSKETLLGIFLDNGYKFDMEGNKI